MSKERRLGRGLEALLGRSLEEQALESAPAPGEDAVVMSSDDSGQRWLDLGAIQPNPFQPRREFNEEAIADLADSIREHGVLQPLLVRRASEGFELVAGERRLRAAQAAGWERVPVQVRDLTDQQTAELAIVENVQRKDLNAIEKALGFQRYLEEYGCTQEDLAKRIHIDRSTIANLIRLLDLPEAVRQMVVGGELSQGHARAILGVADGRREEFARRIVREGLSVRKTEQAVQDEAPADDGDFPRIVGTDGVSRDAVTPRAAQNAALQTELQKALGTKVELRQTAKGKGRITIHFASGEEFERLRELLVSPPTSAATGTE